MSPTCLLCGTPLDLPQRPKGGGSLYLCRDCYGKRRVQQKRWINRRMLQQAVDAYGDRCAYCGEDELLFLTIDHVEGGGAADRRRGRQGSKMYYWLRANDYPDGFQVLCYNCNFKKGATITADDGTA